MTHQSRVVPVLVFLLFVISCNSFAIQESERAWLGVVVKDVSTQTQEEKGGALIVKVIKNSPAESAGLRAGDVILRVNTIVIKSSRDLVRIIRRLQPNEKVDILYRREKSEKNTSITLAEAPRRNKQQVVHIQRGLRGTWCEGMKLHTLTEQLAEFLGVPENEGVLVEEVVKGSSAANAGVIAGDVIVRIGKKRVDEVRDVWKEFMNYEEGDTVIVEVIRNRSVQQVSLKLESVCYPPMFPRFHGCLPMIDSRVFEEPFDFCDYFRKFNSEVQKRVPKTFDDEL